MKDYTAYSVEDFVCDESYIRYYFKEDEEDVQFWKNWISRHPEKLDVVISADNYIDAFSIRLPDTELQREQQRFADAIKNLSEDPAWLQQPVKGMDDSFLVDIESAKARPERTSRRKAMTLGLLLVLLVVFCFSIIYAHRVSTASPTTQNIHSQDSTRLQKKNITTGKEQ